VDSEWQQVVRSAHGDAEAFRSIWTAHRDAVYRFACWMTQDPAVAEDITQECFLVLLEHPSRFDPARAALRTFLLAIVRNHCRTRWREAQAEVCGEDFGVDSDPVSVLDQLVITESSTILNTAVSNLPPLQREAVFLFEFEDLTLEAAAQAAGTDVGTFKSRLYRGRQRLKRQLHWLVKEGF
jgi:RNA polymerase sigma-70 factor (ECF subfamily)